MQFLKLPWLVSGLLLFHILMDWARDDPDKTSKVVDLTSPGALLKHHAALSQSAGPAIPVLAVASEHGTTTLARLLASIDHKVEHVVVLQLQDSAEVATMVSDLKKQGMGIEAVQFPGPVGHAEAWNWAMEHYPNKDAWVMASDSVEFKPGALLQFNTELITESQLWLRNATTKGLLLPGWLRATAWPWPCFALLHPAVRQIGLFDLNLFPSSQEMADYLVRLSHAGLWLRELGDVRLVSHASEFADKSKDKTFQARQQRQEEGRPYFALKWGRANTIGVYDMQGNWHQKCSSSGHCKPAPPVLYTSPFNDPALPLSFTAFDAQLRKCVLSDAKGPCYFNRALLKHPNLLPKGNFDGVKWIAVKQAEEPVRKHKNFVYLIQSAKRRKMDPPLHETEDRDVIWLTHHDNSGDIFAQRSTWTQGRNTLLNEAMKRAVEMGKGGYLYYIFMDGDVILRSRDEKRLWYRSELPPDPFDRFETFLKDWEPAVGTVAYWWTLYDQTQVSIHHNNDAVFSAHHRETLSFGLPYTETLDCRSWYYSQHIMNSLNAMLYNTRRVQFNGMEARNEEHVHGYNREMTWIRPSCFVLNAVLPSSPLRKILVVDPNPAYTPGKPQKRDKVSYIVPLEFIYEHFNLSHPMVSRALEFRKRLLVEHLLNESMQIAPYHYEDDYRTCEDTGPDDRRCFSGECPAGIETLCTKKR